MLRVALFFTVLSLALPAAAQAALPPAHPPDVAALRKQGVRVDWPLTKSVRLPVVSELRVPVKSKRRVTVSLVVVDGEGRYVKTESKRALRDGEFVAWPNRSIGERMALRLDVGRERYWSWIRFAEQLDAPVTCEHGAEVAPTLFVGKDQQYRAGGRFLLGMHNPGRCPLGFDELIASWQRPTASGGWEDVPVTCATNTVLMPGQHDGAICDRVRLLTALRPGGTESHSPQVPLGLVPGHYRLGIYYKWTVPLTYREVDVVA